jgi:hypothetical protein
MVFRDMAEHKLFAAAHLFPAAAADGAAPTAAAALARRAIDGAVYTAWRNLRLPLCSKRRENGTNGAVLLPFAVADLGAASADGDAAPADTDGKLRALLARYAVAVSEGAPAERFFVAALGEQVEDHGSVPRAAGADAAFVAVPLALLESALIVRGATAPDDVLRGSAVPFAGSAEAATAAAAGGSSTIDAHALNWGDASAAVAAPRVGEDGKARAALAVGYRHPCNAAQGDALLAVFQGLHASYATAVTQLTRAEHEDNGQVRAFYGQQKQSKFCLARGDAHKGTFGSIYVTYGSVKYRCWSNDACGTACLRVPWSDATEPLRRALFPPLSEAQLRARYPENYAAAADEDGGGSVDEDAIARTVDDDEDFDDRVAAVASA